MNAAGPSAEPPDKMAERGRMNYWLQHISKMLNKNVKKMTSDDLLHIKYATSKLLQLIQQLEKSSKEAFMKQHPSIDTLITVLQIVTCEQTVSNIINIFIDVVGKTQTSKRASVLVNHGLTTVLFQILKLAHSGDIALSDDVLISIHVLLSRIGHRDRKFAVKARLHQSLILTLTLVKTHFHNFRNLQPLLQVLKLYTNNNVNASYLGKHNSVTIMFKVIAACGKRHTVDLRLALENLTNMTRSKSNSARLIGMGGVPQLLSLHSEWQHTDTKHRYLSIRRSILHILKNITNLKSGRKAFVEADGIRILYESALEVSDCRDMESLILLASVILRKCCPRNKLPLDCPLSAVLFPLPASSSHTPECYYLANYPGKSSSQSSSQSSSGTSVQSNPLSDNSSPTVDQPQSTNQQEGYLAEKFDKICDAFRSFVLQVPNESGQGRSRTEESDQSSLDDDDDIDSDDERFRTDHEEPDEDQQDGIEPAEKRTSEDLRMYDTFFPELLEQQILPFPPPAQTVLHRSVSGYLTTRPSTLGGEITYMKQVSSDASLYDMHKRASLDFATTSRYFQQQCPQRCASRIAPSDKGAGQEEKSVSAINLKTGASVISLDVAPRQQSVSSRTNKSLAKGKQKKKALPPPRDRRNIRRTSSTRLEAETLSDSISTLGLPNQDGEDPDQGRCSSIEDLEEDFMEPTHDTQLYSQMAAQTHSVYRFQKLAFPELYGVKGPSKLMEGLFPRKFGVQRAKIFEDIDRMIHADQLVDRTVYDLDKIVADAGSNYTAQNSNLSNRDELRVGYVDVHVTSLKFNSQFECGNLRKVIQVRQYEYDLILSPDINSNHHHQWFYFEVSNMQADQPYRFNIVNCEKLNSQLNFGMQPLMMSVMDALQGNPCWLRVGSDICYYKNHFIRNSSTTGGVQGKAYYTATFTLTYQHSGDICYLSYHYPYSYTALETHLKQWERLYDPSLIYFRNQSLCTTLGGNSVPVLTITAQPRSTDKEGLEEFRSRPYIFLSGRVHPGESNASWVMKGTIDFLMSKKPQAQQVREMYIFKIVPMLNPDGVVNGNHRSSLVAEDLNRRWGKPCSVLHPTIYHTKGLLLYLNMVNKTPLVYCDYHGHSRRKNIFLYGCSPGQSWISNDTQNPASTGNKANDMSFKHLPRLLHNICPSFCLQNCSYVVEKAKENTARVVVWRQIGVVRSYTMESSYCGCDQGKYKDQHINTAMLEEMGQKFCETLIKLARQKGTYDQQMPVFDMDSGVVSGATAEDFLDEFDESSSASFKKKGSEINVESLIDASDSEDDEDEEEEEEFDDDVMT